jgi:uncharacterized protein (TIGR03437 family)
VLAAITVATPARGDITGASNAPSYSAGGLVQAAAQKAEPLAPNTLATLYGTNLSFTTRAASAADIVNGALPTVLEGVSVFVNFLPVPMLYVSPAQVNFLIPYNIGGSSASLYVERQNLTGPVITVPIAIAAPSFFAWNGNVVISTHADGSLISAGAPAAAGEIIVLYAAGLGWTLPKVIVGAIVSGTTTLYYASQLQVSLNGAPCDPGDILYAGIAPGFPGLYQINLRLPDPLPGNPVIQVAIGALISPPNLQLPTF